MSRALVAPLLLVLASTASGATPGRGRVRFVTAKRAYLDSGRLQGLKLGDQLELQRHGKRAATCTIDQLSDKGASCLADARIGDVFALPSAPPARPVAPPPPAMPPPVDNQTASAQLAATPVDKIEFRGRSALRPNGLPIISATLSHTSYVTFGGSHFQQERLDFHLDGINMRFGGFRAFAHLTAIVYSARPNETRFRPGDIFQLYVWDLEASSREIGRPFTLSLGRVWPHHAPGLTMLDGAQVGWRSKSGDAEVGALGGTIPEVSTLYPSAHWVGGVYYGVTHARLGRRFFRLIRHEGRLSVRDTVTAGPLLELEELVQAWIHKAFDVSAQARATIGAGDWTTPRLEAGRVSFGVQPSAKLRAYVNFRYLGTRAADPDALLPSLFSTGTWYYTDASLAWTPKPFISLSATGGVAQRTDESYGRQYVGAEIGFPTMFRGIGGLGVGYREEFGWLSGRTAYLNATVAWLDRLRFFFRGSYFEDNYDSNKMREVGMSAMVDGRVTRWLSIRAYGMARVEVTPRIPEIGTPAGLIARLDLTGSF